ncbi:hypothetical protein MMC13_006079 [Lambiella insularis]|nr:hypothetical protein [Lambiella insularis]
MIVYIELCAPHGGQSQLDYLAAISAAQCENQNLSIAVGVFNILSDFYILCIPLPAIWSLQMPRRRKIGVSAIFLTGIAACLSSILSFVYRLKLSESTDNTWTVIPLWVVSIIEITSGFLVSCMPSVAATYRHVQPRIATLLGSYQQRLRGYGSFTDSYELNHASDSSTTRLKRGVGRVEAFKSANSHGAKNWGPSKRGINDQGFDAELQQSQNTGIRKMTQVKVVQGPRGAIHRLESWGIPSGGMV